MKKQRWKFTKVHFGCEHCGKKLDIRNKMHVNFLFCSVACGYEHIGMAVEKFS